MTSHRLDILETSGFESFVDGLPWLPDTVVCVVGDVYGTGRQDIVVGNFSSPKTDHPVKIWRNGGKR